MHQTKPGTGCDWLFMRHADYGRNAHYRRTLVSRALHSTSDAAVASDVVELALRLVSVPSMSGAEGPAAAALAEILAERDFSVQVDDYGNVIGTLEFGPGPTILFDGHLDTVPVVDAGDWIHDPFGEVADGKLFGLGAVDLKGPLAACVHGISKLRGSHSVGTAVVSGSVNEELAEGSALIHVAERVRPDAVVICEPSGGRLITSQRGRAEIKVEVRGESCHSAYPEAGRNAAEAMVDVIRGLRVLPMPEHASLGPAALVVTDVVSRPYPSMSVVPDRCIASFDRRTLPGESMEAVIQPIQTVCDDVAAIHGVMIDAHVAEIELTTYTEAVVSVVKFAPAWVLAPDTPIVVAAAAGLGRENLPVQLGHYAFCTNGSGSAGTLGIPTIGFGPGAEARAHTADESIDVEELFAGARGYEALARALTGMTPEGVATSKAAALTAVGSPKTLEMD